MSLLGAIICMVVMFLCDSVIGTIVLVITLLLYLFVSYRKLGESLFCRLPAVPRCPDSLRGR